MALSFQTIMMENLCLVIGVNFSLDMPADCQDKSFCVSVLSDSKYFYF